MARSERAIVLALTGLLILISLMQPGPAAAVCGLAVLGLSAVAWRRRAVAASSMALLFVPCLVLALLGVGPQQVTFALAFAVYAVVSRRVWWLREARRWFTAGRFDAPILAASVGFALASGAALLTWYAILRPDLGDLVRAFIPDWPLWILAVGAVLFSFVNAAVEEAAYRGVVLDALDRTIGAGATAVVLQAAAFAALHLQAGFPRGWMGVTLTFVYGLALGLLRRYAGGLLAPFVTHVLTDIVIMAIVLILVR
jgi:membrane protease YdiL (CAAX protease family)